MPPSDTARIGGVPVKRTPPIWIFIALDCTSFGLFFVVFMAERMGQPDLFDQSARLLDARLGFVNALILITSSWLVAWAVQVGLAGRIAQARRLIVWSMVVGSGFALVKAYEYYAKISEGLTIATNGFFTFYYALTGIHLLHYLVGMVLLGVLARGPGWAPTEEESVSRYKVWLEGGGLYWHMVDLLWIFIFSLLYLVGAR